MREISTILAFLFLALTGCSSNTFDEASAKAALAEAIKDVTVHEEASRFSPFLVVNDNTITVNVSTTSDYPNTFQATFGRTTSDTWLLVEIKDITASNVNRIGRQEVGKLSLDREWQYYLSSHRIEIR